MTARFLTQISSFLRDVRVQIPLSAFSNMKAVYKKILEKALPYCEKRRRGDVEHVKWIFETIPKFINEDEIGFDILMPVVILHDVGYSKVQGDNFDPFDLDIRKLHSEEGAKIAEEILRDLSYGEEKIEEIKRLILKHDNWAFGDSFEDEPVLRAFSNFDWLWCFSDKGFKMFQRIVNKSPKEAYEKLKEFQAGNERVGIKWFNKKIENYFNERMKKLKEEVFKD